MGYQREQHTILPSLEMLSTRFLVGDGILCYILLLVSKWICCLLEKLFGFVGKTIILTLTQSILLFCEKRITIKTLLLQTI